MSATFRAHIVHGLSDDSPFCELGGIAPELVGHAATLSLRVKVDVKRSSGVGSAILHCGERSN